METDEGGRGQRILSNNDVYKKRLTLLLQRTYHNHGESPLLNSSSNGIVYFAKHLQCQHMVSSGKCLQTDEETDRRHQDKHRAESEMEGHHKTFTHPSVQTESMTSSIISDKGCHCGVFF